MILDPCRRSHNKPFASPSRQRRANGVQLVNPPLVRDFTFDVQHFNIYRTLKRTRTVVKNTLPTSSMIETEHSINTFETSRRLQPEKTNYKEFYRSLTFNVHRLCNSRCKCAECLSPCVSAPALHHQISKDQG
ncbi:uncharacterized protein LOC131956556 [Physella acuta]|uniref:uncharacterized protein LOC131956556 n=1 Tax=Physella acuta TaxID=109671 RepID=UPI0027DE0644|nr:uncharacterized protein LOC131956556 [Physella acuta]